MVCKECERGVEDLGSFLRKYRVRVIGWRGLEATWKFAESYFTSWGSLAIIVFKPVSKFEVMV